MAGNRRRKQNSRGNGLALLGVTLLVALLAFTVNLRSQTLRKQEQAYAMQEENLQEEIQSEQQRTRQLEEKKKYVTTKQYIEQVAKEKLGLIDPDEVLLKEKDE